MTEVTLNYGVKSAIVQIEPAKLLKVRRHAEPTSVGDPVAILAASLEAPTRFPSLWRALTPDDHVALVVDENVPELESLVPPIIDHIGKAGVRPGQVTVVLRTNADRPDLENAWPGVVVETHDPSDRNRLSYLATTKGGRRIYINRSVGEADQIIVLAEVRFHEPATRMLFPALSDQETIDDVSHESHDLAVKETKEVAWLLGLPFFIQVIAGPGDSVGNIISGPFDTRVEASQQLREFWHVETDRLADLAIVSLGGEPATQTTTDLDRAMANAGRVVKSGGIIVLMSQSPPQFDDAFRMIQEASSTDHAHKMVHQFANKESHAARQWLKSVKDHRVMIFGDWQENIVEELFATHIQSVPQLQRIIEGAESCIYLPDGQRIHAAVVE